MSFRSRLSQIRVKIREGTATAEDKSLLERYRPGQVKQIEDGTYVPMNYRDVTVTGYGRQGRAEAYALKQSLLPIFDAYRDAIAQNPDLRDQNTILAAWVTMMENARSTKQIMDCLDRIQKVAGHEKNRVQLDVGLNPDQLDQQILGLCEGLGVELVEGQAEVQDAAVRTSGPESAEVAGLGCGDPDPGGGRGVGGSDDGPPSG